MAGLKQLDALIRDLNDRNIEDKINREAIGTTHAGIVERIFQQGRDSSESNLGTYPEGYLEFRRRVHNRTNRKINLQLTGQMKNDFTPLKILGDNRYGSGFSNAANAEKSRSVERTYRTSIFELSSKEEKELKENFEFVARKRLSR